MGSLSSVSVRALVRASYQVSEPRALGPGQAEQAGRQNVAPAWWKKAGPGARVRFPFPAPAVPASVGESGVCRCEVLWLPHCQGLAWVRTGTAPRSRNRKRGLPRKGTRRRQLCPAKRGKPKPRPPSFGDLVVTLVCGWLRRPARTGLLAVSESARQSRGSRRNPAGGSAASLRFTGVLEQTNDMPALPAGELAINERCQQLAIPIGEHGPDLKVFSHVSVGKRAIVGRSAYAETGKL